MSRLSMTGRWSGHYVQQGKESPITADFLEANGRLSGFMYDGRPDNDYSLWEVAAEAGLPPGADEQIGARLREMVPDAPAGPIRYVSHLPANSTLQGKREGQVVYFLKSYQGASFGGYQVGNRLVGVQNAGHQVHYEGRLSADGVALEGRWRIDPNPQRGTPGNEGLFRLCRAGAVQDRPGAASPAAEEEKRPWWRFWS
jgi:hypothetical protein